MKTYPFKCIWIVGVALFASPGLAADAVGTPVQAFDDPDAKSTATGTENRVVLEAGDADAKATIRLANIFKPDPLGTKFGSYSFTVSAPFDSKKADSVDVGTLSGLTAGTSANFEYSFWQWPDANTDQLGKLTQHCVDVIPKLIGQAKLGTDEDWKKVSRVGEVVCHRGLFEVEALNELAKKINAKKKACSKCRQVPDKPPTHCKLLGDALEKAKCKSEPSKVQKPDQESAEQTARRLRDEMTQAALCALVESDQRHECAECEGWSSTQNADCDDLQGMPEAALVDDAAEQIALIKADVIDAARSARKAMWGVTLGAKANHQNFSFVLPAAPTTAEDSSETGVGFSIGYTYVGIKNLFTAGYSHEESYKASGKVQVCSPIGTTGSSACKEASLGAPRKEKAELAYLEAKRIIKAGRFAIAPRVEYDFEESNYAVRVPLYFIANKEHQLTAGVALGYTDADDEGFGAAVFVSKAFAFFE